MNEKDGLLVGIDGGGSSTTVAVANKEGKVLSLKRAGPSRLETVGVEGAKKEISDGLKDALVKYGLNFGDIEVICFGFGGLDSPSNKRQAEKIAEEIAPDIKSVVENDAAIGLFSGTFGKPGIALIAGTGTLLVGLNSNGDRARVDGWGHLFGDLGSAYYLGRRAVKKSLEDFDGRGQETALRNMIVENLNLGEISEAMNYFYGRKNEAKSIAEMSPLVDRAAEEGDEVATELLESAAQELQHSALTLIDRLNMKEASPLRIVLIGGVFNSTRLTTCFKNLVTKKHSQVRFIKPDWDPVVGAIVFALKETERGIEGPTLERLKKEFKETRRWNS